MESNPTRRRFLKQTGAVAASAISVAYGLAGEDPPADTPKANPALELDTAPESADALLNSDILQLPPAVFRPSPNQLTFHWKSASKLKPVIRTGTNPADLRPAAAQGIVPGPTAVISGAFQNARVYWQMQLEDEAGKVLNSDTYSLQAGRKPDETFRVAFFADSHLYSALNKPPHMENLRKTVRRIIQDQPDFVVFLGDEAGVHFLGDKPRQRSQELALERWRTWRRVMKELLIRVPGVMVLGNHEGEAGYYQTMTERGIPAHLQRWGTIARKECFLNPLPDSNPEGGENENWRGSQTDAATGGAEQGNCSPLQNYFAWTWGDALFVVLDVHRYTRVGLTTPDDLNQWTLGPAQLRWLEQVLAGSRAKWKFVIAHHLVGGSKWDLNGDNPHSNYVYGRGGGRYARAGEQSKITDLMLKHGAQCFFYGHDHVFAHQPAEGLHFVCCGRPTFLQPDWWRTAGWKEAYGETSKRNPNDFYGAIGYTQLEVSPRQVAIQYIRTGTDRDRAENIDTPEGQSVYGYTLKI